MLVPTKPPKLAKPKPEGTPQVQWVSDRILNKQFNWWVSGEILYHGLVTAIFDYKTWLVTCVDVKTETISEYGVQSEGICATSRAGFEWIVDGNVA